MTPLYLLAFDHRASFAQLVGTTDPVRIADAKTVVYEGFEHAASDGLGGDLGILVDEQFGADVARRARAAGHVLAMPVERSGVAEFQFEYGPAFRRHVEEFEPQYVKVLVRYNPDGDRELNSRQAVRLRTLSEWLRAEGRKLLFELLVPPTSEQLERLGGDAGRFDAVLRPGLTVRTMRELQEAGVEPDVWKLEGFERREECLYTSAQARTGGRHDVTCIVLGRGADADRVAQWLEEAARVEGYSGFAVGRTLWWNELTAYVRGELPREQAAQRIAANFAALVRVYERARVATR